MHDSKLCHEKVVLLFKIHGQLMLSCEFEFLYDISIEKNVLFHLKYFCTGIIIHFHDSDITSQKHQTPLYIFH